MDKRREKRILEFVYVESSLRLCREFESPDFLIDQANGSQPYGVEICELYGSSSEARLQNLDTYFSELIDTEQYRHKDDIKELKIVDAKIYDPDGVFKSETRAVLQKGLSVGQYRNRLTALLDEKDIKADRYLEESKHVNLVIFDNAMFLSQFELEDYFQVLFGDEVKKRMLTTKFREVTLVTCFKGEEWVVLPLRTALLLGELFTFQEVLLQHKLGPFESQKITEFIRELENVEDLTPVFAAHLASKATNVRLHKIHDTPLTVLGASAAGFSRGSHRLYQHGDCDWPPDLAEPNPDAYEWLLGSKDFRTRITSVLAENKFMTAFAPKTAREVTFKDLTDLES